MTPVLKSLVAKLPYIVSRYDTTTGAVIPIVERIGLLDRKLRAVSENTDTSGQWLEAAQEAYKSTYAYEWQGDSLLIARESMLYSFIEYYRAKFGKNPLQKSINYIAYIISWNVWQMDGLKGVVPGSCKDKVHTEVSLFGESKEIVTPARDAERITYSSTTGRIALSRTGGPKTLRPDAKASESNISTS